MQTGYTRMRSIEVTFIHSNRWVFPVLMIIYMDVFLPLLHANSMIIMQETFESHYTAYSQSYSKFINTSSFTSKIAYSEKTTKRRAYKK